MRIFLPAFFVLCSCSSGFAPRAIPASALENAHELIPGLYSGAEPEGAEGFRQLVALGVKTIISVDGAKPDVEGAHRQGLRYVHLPIGYDGVPEERALQLAKALQELPGPIYLHCHHGKHRAPAAAAVACVVAGKLDADQAVRAMKTMGTGEQYLGLWSSARESKPVDPGVLKVLVVDFREISPIPPLADAMVALDHVFDNLGLCRKSGWKKPTDHPDLDPAHEALRAREILAEIMRTEDFHACPATFKAGMEAGRRATEELVSLLRALATEPADPSAAVEGAYQRLRASCTDCHKAHRNRPRK
jgi:protein tyrosine phosphatase (PTP) superfamily phosphohydrolase (DUF442 family)